MFEEKESFWKKKGFYISACTLLVAVIAVGAVYYYKTSIGNDSKLMADIATEVPDPAAEVTASPDVRQDTAQTNAKVSENILKKEDKPVSVNSGKDKNSTAAPKKADKAKKKKAVPKVNQKTPSKTVSATTNQIKHSFQESAGLLWPVQGDVILKYSMNNTVYFKTLAQYRCNPGIVISAKEGTNVKAAADCRVTKIEKDDELGTVVTTDIGSNFTVVYGQLDNISVNKGDELKEGDVIGTIAKPTKYFLEEGSNLYFQVNEGKETVDPLLLLR